MTKTPQEKKRLSYAHDRRNSYGENNKSSRKSVRFRKKWVNQQFRSRVNTAIRTNGEPDDIQSKAAEAQRSDWKKHPDIPLKEWTARQKIRRSKGVGERKARKVNKAFHATTKSGA